MRTLLLLPALLLSQSLSAASEHTDLLKLEDVFSLEYADNPEANADASTVFFERHFMDIHTDKKLSNIWKVTGKNHSLQPVTTGNQNDYSPLLSPSGNRLAYLSNRSGKTQIHIKWLNSGTEGKISNLPGSPANLAWSPDGEWLAFTMFVPGQPKSVVSLPGKPKGAKWAKPATYIDDVYYRFDGAGYIPQGNTHIFLISSDGGNARQLTHGDQDYRSHLSWSKDGQSLYFSANLAEKADLHPQESEVHRLDIKTGEIDTLTSRKGPDAKPVVSPKGDWIAYLGYDDKRSNYENTQLNLMKKDGTQKRVLTADLDRRVSDFKWAQSGKGIYVQYDDHGKTVIAYQPLKGKRKILTEDVGGTTLGRPYTSGTFDVSDNGKLVYTQSHTKKPADLAVLYKGKTQTLTDLNHDALSHKSLAKVEELTLKSKHDGLDIQAWVAYPPGFDANNKDKKYPLLLEIHGGPVAAYGPQFSSEVQLFAAAGYVVLYVNPRGSSSYGKAFAQLIDENYPSQDYDDLMSAVDAVMAKNVIDTEQLYVTGGSGGGTLTSWIIGHTDRFRAAVVAKPVINWFSFVLTADAYPFFSKYWFAKMPWEDIDTYMKQSPISYVGNVTTPTMLLTGEADYRTPMSETEQYYQALQLREVESALVRIPGASHGIANRPSNLMSKVAHILYWFDKHSGHNESTTQ